MKNTKVQPTMRKIVLLLFCLSFFSLFQNSYQITAAEGDAAPTNLKQTEATTTSVTVTWDSANNDDSYVVEYSKDQVNWETTYSYDNNLYISSLEEGTTYYLQIFAEDSSNKSEVLEVSTSPENITGLKQSTATINSITLTWKASAHADGYRIYRGENLIGNSHENSFTVDDENDEKLNKDGTNDYIVYPYRSTTTGYIAMDPFVYKSIYNTKTIPSKMNKPRLAQWFKYAKSIDLDFDTVSNADGYQLQWFNGKNKLIKTTSTKILSNAPFTNVYTVRGRFYVTISGSKKYGAWSDKLYCVPQPTATIKKVTTKKKKVTTTKLKINWGKISGVTGYDVYVATSNNKNSFKKVASVSSKKTSVTISKFKKAKIKKSKKYQVYVIAKKKIGAKTSKSANTYCYSTSGDEGYVH